ncbi:DUF4185 domain-containing protein, partial [Mycolicibacillus koreensis]|uniref:DUF4185 domain-containing protein n=2 Tax=Mycolicibacillus koreensis TaxID=1069220 RepID=UPI0021F3AC5E
MTQLSGFQSSKDGMVYIAADSFARTDGVSMYRVDPEHITDRGAWQPWTGNGFGTNGQAPVPLTDPEVRFSELSFQEVQGKAVLSGFNVTNGPGTVEVRVVDNPPSVDMRCEPHWVVWRLRTLETRMESWRRRNPQRRARRRPVHGVTRPSR